MELIGTGHFFRSAEMEYVSIIMQEHLAHDAVEALGELDSVQFSDLNGDLTAFKRFFTPYVRRCDEVEKQLKFFREEMALHGLPVEQYTRAELSSWLAGQKSSVAVEGRGVPLLEYWEHVIGEKHREYSAVKVERERTSTVLYEAVQRRHVIERAADFFLSESAAAGLRRAAPLGERVEPSLGVMESGGREEEEMGFKSMAGMIDSEDKVRFARIIFRASSGHAIVRFSDVETPLLDEKGVSRVKSVFAIFYRGRSLSGKLDRIATAFNASQHSIPSFDDAHAVRAALDECKAVIGDSIAWLEQERATSSTTLRHIALILGKWRHGVMREKATYHAMNMFTRQVERGTVTANAWVLKLDTGKVHDCLRSVHMAAAAGGRNQPFYFEVLPATTPGIPQPPTHFPTNKVTKVFQGIVNTYGVPRYGEANPALFSIATFPFLFGVMYGDIGHATLLTAFAAYMVLKEADLMKSPLGEIFSMAFKGRYMLLFMGFFSIYCGFIYNDWFAIPLSAFNGSRWAYNGTATFATRLGNNADVYPFGVDPAWHAADNDLLFFNSLKMKMSVVFGITQMTFGLILKTLNAIHFKSRADLFFECIPQLVFMLSLFGYMVFIIILKWSIDWNDPLTRPGAPPSLIDVLINLVLKPGVVTDPLFAGQVGLQSFILLLVFFSVPIMLFGKPLAAHFAKKAAAAHGDEGSNLLHAHGEAPASASAAAGTGAAAAHAPEAAHGGHDEHGFGEVFIHQAIETIEFVLGSVSNTASYLRLWALSLAHSQLSTVFWERAIVANIEGNSALFIVIGYGAWAGVTFGVLLVMDVLECFLHALRLHWVEFQNKFYKADGHKFMPFSFTAIAEAAANEE